MEDQSKPVKNLQTGEQSPPGSETPPTEKAAQPSPRKRVSEERIAVLIQALGDPQHPLHLEAEEELVEIGAPAVPALIAALHEDRPWLMSYRAAEALGQIGDGRASGPLIQTLNHPNSNVRWSAVRALAQVGDTRAMLPLRRVARYDRGKTSWGESVAAAAQAALEQMQSRSALWRLGDPTKTAILFALALAAVIIAVSKIGELRAELQGTTPLAQYVTPVLPTATPPEDGEGGGETQTGQEGEVGAETGAVTPTTGLATSTPSPQAGIRLAVRENSNVRAGPGVDHRVLGQVLRGQTVTVLGISGDWYLITYDDGQSRGWIYRGLLEQPDRPVPTVAPSQIGTTIQP